MKKDPIEIGQKIRSLRESMGLTSEEFGELFNPPASKGTVSKWENGRYLPNNQRLVTIAKLDGKSVEEFLYGQELTFDAIKNIIDNTISGSILSDKEKNYLISHKEELYNAVYVRVREFPNSTFLGLYIADRLINIAEYEVGEELFSFFDQLELDAPYPDITEDFIFFSKSLSFFHYETNSNELSFSSRSFINNRVTLVENLDKRYIGLEEEINKILNLIETEEDENEKSFLTNQISQFYEELEQIENAKKELITGPRFKFYVYNKTIYLISNKNNLTIEDVKFNARQYDNLIVRRNGKEIARLTNVDNELLIDTIEKYHDWNTSIILTVNAWFKMLDLTQHI